MGIFRRKVPSNYIPVHPDNVRNKHWVILLEAGTIVGPSTEKLRVAKATLEKRIVRKYYSFLRKQHFLVARFNQFKRGWVICFGHDSLWP
jgi:hypothetical protein